MYQEIKYFNGLNTLRFFAAYLVVIHHAEQIRSKYDIFNLKQFSIFNNGGIAVTFFFVLSGFLISYLLLKELNRTNTVSVRSFYKRRILRIWPLYFLLIIIGTLVIPYVLKLIGHSYEFPYEFNDVIWYYIFFSPFMVNILFGHHLLEPLWSIGVEELFYIFWAPLYKTFKKHIIKIILGVIIFKILLLLLIPSLNLSPEVIKLIQMLKFEAMAIGGLAAYIIYNRQKEIEPSFLYSKAFQIIMISFILLRIFGFKFLKENSILFDYLFATPIASSLLLMSIFAWFIVNISVNKKSIIKLNNRIFEFLGGISYGIYMYHMLIIFGMVLLFKAQLAKMNDLASTVVFYFILTASVILVSYISKKIFEDRFLRLKTKFRLNLQTAKEQTQKQGII